MIPVTIIILVMSVTRDHECNILKLAVIFTAPIIIVEYGTHNRAL